MKLYVIRHGQTEKNKNHIIADIEEDINETGIRQAITISKELNKKDIDLIICSPSKRTKHTLELLNLDSNIKVIYDDRLIERDMGIYENSKFEDLDWNLFWNYYDKKYKKLESMKDVYDRISNLLDELKEKYKDKNILLITHGGCFRAIYWYIKGIPDSGNVPHDLGNCEIWEESL